jgi:hypothetical protein
MSRGARDHMLSRRNKHAAVNLRQLKNIGINSEETNSQKRLQKFQNL